MQGSQGYRTVAQEARIELIINKSRFIGWCFPVQTEEEALMQLENIRRRHRDATHNCYAYSVGGTGGAARFSDDGEPGGTAGLPMMEAIRHKEVTDLLCVVTRYFGGVLLGAGGLVRAYSKSASAAIETAGLLWMRPCVRFLVVSDYSRWGMLEGYLRQSARVERLEYTQEVTAEALVVQEQAEAFVDWVFDHTDGTIRPQELERCFGAYPIG